MEPITQTPIEVTTEVLTPDLVMGPGQQLPITLDSLRSTDAMGDVGASTEVVAPSIGAEQRHSPRSVARLRRLGSGLL